MEFGGILSDFINACIGLWLSGYRIELLCIVRSPGGCMFESEYVRYDFVLLFYRCWVYMYVKELENKKPL